MCEKPIEKSINHNLVFTQSDAKTDKKWLV